MLVHEEENKKLHTENDKLKKEKTDLVGQLAKIRGHSDSLDSKLEKISEEVEDKIEAEVADLKKVIMNELKGIKIQIDKSKFFTSNDGDKGTANRNSSKIPTIINARPETPVSSNPEKKRHSAFIAGDSITRALSTGKMRDDNLDVQIKTHPGGKVKTLESTFSHMASKDPDQLKSLDAVVLHVGTNNVSDGDRSENIVNDYKDTIDTLKSVNSNVKILVSSLIPRRNDRLVNNHIRETNAALDSMCKREGYLFINNDTRFVCQGAPDTSLYRDNIHLNAKGGKAIGETMRSALDKVLGISTHTKSTDSNFRNGRFYGRGSRVHYQNQWGPHVSPVSTSW